MWEQVSGLQVLVEGAFCSPSPPPARRDALLHTYCVASTALLVVLTVLLIRERSGRKAFDAWAETYSRHPISNGLRALALAVISGMRGAFIGFRANFVASLAPGPTKSIAALPAPMRTVPELRSMSPLHITKPPSPPPRARCFPKPSAVPHSTSLPLAPPAVVEAPPPPPWPPSAISRASRTVPPPQREPPPPPPSPRAFILARRCSISSPLEGSPASSASNSRSSSPACHHVPPGCDTNSSRASSRDISVRSTSPLLAGGGIAAAAAKKAAAMMAARTPVAASNCVYDEGSPSLDTAATTTVATKTRPLALPSPHIIRFPPPPPRKYLGGSPHVTAPAMQAGVGGAPVSSAPAPPAAPFSLVLQDISASRASNTLRKLPLGVARAHAAKNAKAESRACGLAQAPSVTAMLARQASAEAEEELGHEHDDDAEWRLAV